MKRKNLRSQALKENQQCRAESALHSLEFGVPSSRVLSSESCVLEFSNS
jgi:hypothetical protein